MRVNDVVRGRVEGMTREVESGTHGCRGGKKALRIMWIVCRQDCGSAWACAAREALRRCACGRARTSKLRGRARLRRKNANSPDKSMQKSVAGLGILW